MAELIRRLVRVERAASLAESVQKPDSHHPSDGAGGMADGNKASDSPPFSSGSSSPPTVARGSRSRHQAPSSPRVRGAGGSTAGSRGRSPPRGGTDRRRAERRPGVSGTGGT